MEKKKKKKKTDLVTTAGYTSMKAFLQAEDKQLLSNQSTSVTQAVHCT